MTAATSPLRLSSRVCAHITSYPSACSAGITLLKHEPSAHSPCANTMLGFCDTMDFPLRWCASQDGDRARTRKWGGPAIAGHVVETRPVLFLERREVGRPLLGTGIVMSDGGAS